MDELCHSIGRQNATMLTDSLANSITLSPHATSQRSQPYVGKHNDRGETEKTQGSTDCCDESVNARVCIQDGKEEQDNVEDPFADGLNAYIPEDSALMRSIKSRSPRALFVNERYPSGCTIDDLSEGVLRELCYDSNLSTGGALIIQDVSEDWAEILRSEYPKSVHSTFLAEHMIRLDGLSATDVALEQLRKDLSSSCPGTKMDVKRPTNGRSIVEFDFPFRPSTHMGLHVDFLFETIDMDRVPSDFSFSGGPRRNVFEKDASNRWRRVSHRMSWCQLEKQFYLILVDSSPDFDTELSWAALREIPFQIMLDPRIDASKFWTQSRLAIQYAKWNTPDSCLSSMIAQLLQHHTVNSAFAPKAVPVNESLRKLRPKRHGVESSFASRTVRANDRAHHITPAWGNRQILVWLLTESAWQLAVSTLESKWQHVRPRVARLAGAESFRLLTGLRRQVADAQDLIVESREACIQTLKETRHWIVNGRVLNADEFWSGRPSAPDTVIFRHAQSMDIRNLPDSFEKLEERVSAMTRAINQEIQVVIGSVQVEDAKTMKRQTEWMVALALLAAIYLPMTLVTGIFGMNISEINADKTFPTRWAAVKAWGIVFGATIGCILLYAMLRRPLKWLMSLRVVAKRKAMDIEALKE